MKKIKNTPEPSDKFTDKQIFYSKQNSTSMPYLNLHQCSLVNPSLSIGGNNQRCSVIRRQGMGEGGQRKGFRYSRKKGINNQSADEAIDKFNQEQVNNNMSNQNNHNTHSNQNEPQQSTSIPQSPHQSPTKRLMLYKRKCAITQRLTKQHEGRQMFGQIIINNQYEPMMKRNTVNTVHRFSNKMLKKQYVCSNKNGNGNGNGNGIGKCNSNRNSIISEEFLLFPFKCGMSMGSGLDFWGKGKQGVGKQIEKQVEKGKQVEQLVKPRRLAWIKKKLRYNIKNTKTCQKPPKNNSTNKSTITYQQSITNKSLSQSNPQPYRHQHQKSIKQNTHTNTHIYSHFDTNNKITCKQINQMKQQIRQQIRQKQKYKFYPYHQYVNLDSKDIKDIVVGDCQQGLGGSCLRGFSCNWVGDVGVVSGEVSVAAGVGQGGQQNRQQNIKYNTVIKCKQVQRKRILKTKQKFLQPQTTTHKPSTPSSANPNLKKTQQNSIPPSCKQKQNIKIQIQQNKTPTNTNTNTNTNKRKKQEKKRKKINENNQIENQFTGWTKVTFSQFQSIDSSFIHNEHRR